MSFLYIWLPKVLIWSTHTLVPYRLKVAGVLVNHPPKKPYRVRAVRHLPIPRDQISWQAFSLIYHEIIHISWP